MRFFECKITRCLGFDLKDSPKNIRERIAERMLKGRVLGLGDCLDSKVLFFFVK